MFSLEYILQALHSPARKDFILHELGCLESRKSLREALVSKAAWGFQTGNILLTKTSHYFLCDSQPVTVLAITKTILKLQCPREIIFYHHTMQAVKFIILTTSKMKLSQNVFLFPFKHSYFPHGLFY